MKIFLIILIIMFISLNVFAVTIPDTVSLAFAKKFPKAENVNWEQENDTVYAASFILNSIKCFVSYTGTGDWLEYKSQIGYEFLPKKIQDDYRSNFKDVKLYEVYLIHTSLGTRKYEIKYKKDDDSFEVLYDEAGDQIK